MLGAASLVAAGVSGAWSRGNLPCDIWAQVGDSLTYSGLNADGSAGYDPAIDVTNPRCLEERNGHQAASKNFEQIAIDQFDYNDGSPTGIPVGSIGCGLTFMRDYWLPSKLVAGRNVMFCANGIGGTGSAAWMTGGTQAPTAITRINGACSQNAGNVLKGAIIVLGTNDAIGSMSGATFLSNITSLVSYFRANLTQGANLPFLFVGLVPAWVSGHTGTAVDIDAALKSIPANISKTGYVDMTGMLGQNAIPYHLTAAAQRLIGNPGLPNALANLSA